LRNDNYSLASFNLDLLRERNRRLVDLPLQTDRFGRNRGSVAVSSIVGSRDGLEGATPVVDDSSGEIAVERMREEDLQDLNCATLHQLHLIDPQDGQAIETPRDPVRIEHVIDENGELAIAVGVVGM
ncbi:hypothetical protein PFISCL1PPCAC_11990, partial [Pristionchus fissidentatus]